MWLSITYRQVPTLHDCTRKIAKLPKSGYSVQLGILLILPFFIFHKPGVKTCIRLLPSGRYVIIISIPHLPKLASTYLINMAGTPKLPQCQNFIRMGMCGTYFYLFQKTH